MSTPVVSVVAGGPRRVPVVDVILDTKTALMELAVASGLLDLRRIAARGNPRPLGLPDFVHPANGHLLARTVARDIALHDHSVAFMRFMIRPGDKDRVRVRELEPVVDRDEGVVPVRRQADRDRSLMAHDVFLRSTRCRAGHRRARP
jgi:hypothetical protein